MQFDPFKDQTILTGDRGGLGKTLVASILAALRDDHAMPRKVGKKRKQPRPRKKCADRKHRTRRR